MPPEEDAVAEPEVAPGQPLGNFQEAAMSKLMDPNEPSAEVTAVADPIEQAAPVQAEPEAESPAEPEAEAASDNEIQEVHSAHP